MKGVSKFVEKSPRGYPENFCEMEALRHVFLHSGAILGAYIAEGRILVFSVVLYNYNSSTVQLQQ